MEHALLTHDFSLSYVAQNNSRDTPVLYSITGLWSALAGSILLWGVVLGGYATAMVWRFRRRSGDDLIGWATLVVYVVRRLLLRAHARALRSVPARRRGHPGQRARPQLTAPEQSTGPHPPAHALSGAGGVHPSLRLRHRLADHRQARRRLAGGDPPVDPVRLGLPDHGDPARGLVVLRGARAGEGSGAGTRSRTPPSCPGWSGPPTSTR